MVLRCSIVLVLGGALFAQNERLAEVKGEVMDMLGRPIAGAEVVYTNVGNAYVWRTRTDKNGRFDILGLMIGVYHVEITGPAGKHIYSGTRPAYGTYYDAALNVTNVDLSILPPSTSLAPFKGPSAQQIQGAAWRRFTKRSLKDLTPGQVAELREENSAIAHYIELAPEAEAAIKTQDWPRAQTLLEQMAAIAPYMWQIYSNLGQIQLDRGRYSDAIASFEKALGSVEYDETLNKDGRRLNAVLAQIMMGEGEAYGAWDQLHPAVAAYRRAAEIDPHPALAYMHLCVTEYNTGQLDEALNDCRAGIAADPRRPEFYEILGGIESNLEKYEEAIVVYDKGVRLALGTLDAVKNATRSAVPAPADEYSITALNRSVARQMMPEGGAFYKARAGQMLLSEGNAYFQLRKFKQAAGLFERATKLHNYPALAYFNLCAARFDMAEWKAASEACDRAIAGDAQMADAYYVKAAALFGEAARQGRSKAPLEALGALRKYLELDPGGSHSREVQAMLREIPTTEH